MGEPSHRGFKGVTVLRGEALREARLSSAPASPASPASPTGSGTERANVPGSASPAATASGSPETIYGVPVSAVQHCCGRGCKHCRIYWHRLKP